MVYAGVDYARILGEAGAAASVILWDGGNNDFPFIRPDLHIVLVDPLRPGHEATHHPGETVLRMADVVVVAKTDAAAAADVQQVTDNVRRINPEAAIVRAASPIRIDESAVRGRRVVVVEDGPTVTHGGMPYGAGYVAATRAQAAVVVDARPYAAPGIAAVYAAYPHLGPIVRVRYEFAEAGEPGLGAVLAGWLERTGFQRARNNFARRPLQRPGEGYSDPMSG